MGEDPGQVGQAVAPEDRTPEQIEADIERTRREMGETVAAVALKADVKAQAKAKVHEVRERVLGKKDDVVSRAKSATPETAGQGAQRVAEVARANRRPLVIGAAVLVAFVLGRRSSRP
jgi:ElaB/YqjD/DUF883 family membrane-anchored ribosome-binding protein